MVRMLCVRSASLTRITRRSRTIASSILRKLSACASCAALELDLVELGDAVDDLGDVVAEARRDLLLGVGVSSMTSCRIARDQRVGVEVQVGEDLRGRDRVRDVGFAGEALLALVGGGAELGGGADALDLLGRQVAADLAEQVLEARSALGCREAGPVATTRSPWACVRSWGASAVLRQSRSIRPNCGARKCGFVLRVGQRRGDRLRLRLAQHLGRDVARGDLAQRQHRGLVVVDRHGGFGAIGQAARALRGQQHQLEQVIDVLQAVFDGDSGHGVRNSLRKDRGTNPSSIRQNSRGLRH